MGRDAGWIAITSGIAGGADVIFVPEKPIDIDQAVKILKERHDRGKLFSIVVVAEGAKLPGTDKQATQGAKLDAFGHARLSGIGQTVAELIEEKTGYETRSVNLGHTQRGGTPTAYDRMLATRYGSAAIDLVHEGKFGRLVVLRGTEITHIPLEDAIAKTRTIGDDLIALAAMLRIPVYMHNVANDRIFRPSAWAAFGTQCLARADYRACVTCDLDMDTADFAAGHKITVPLLVIWGQRSHTEGVHGDVLAVWKKNYAEDAWGGALPCGHYVPEEAPDETYEHFIKHFKI